jgi:hypothetical protein
MRLRPGSAVHAAGGQAGGRAGGRRRAWRRALGARMRMRAREAAQASAPLAAAVCRPRAGRPRVARATGAHLDVGVRRAVDVGQVGDVPARRVQRRQPLLQARVGLPVEHRRARGRAMRPPCHLHHAWRGRAAALRLRARAGQRFGRDLAAAAVRQLLFTSSAMPRLRWCVPCAAGGRQLDGKRGAAACTRREGSALWGEEARVTPTSIQEPDWAAQWRATGIAPPRARGAARAAAPAARCPGGAPRGAPHEGAFTAQAQRRGAGTCRSAGGEGHAAVQATGLGQGIPRRNQGEEGPGRRS